MDRTINVLQGVSYCFEILWRPLRPPKNNFLVMMKVSVYFRGVVIGVSSTSFHKSNIAWPQQPPKEKDWIGFLMNYSTKRDQHWSFWCQGWSNHHDQEFLGGYRAGEAGEANEVAEAAEVNEAAEVSWVLKITSEDFRVILDLEIMNLRTKITLFWRFEKFFFWQNHEIPFWI